MPNEQLKKRIKLDQCLDLQDKLITLLEGYPADSAHTVMVQLLAQIDHENGIDVPKGVEIYLAMRKLVAETDPGLDWDQDVN